MKRAGVFLTLVLVFGLVANLFLSSCGGKSQPVLKVVAGTSLISAIVAEIGGERTNVVSIIPPTQNPSDFESEPEALKVLEGANLFLIHDWQREKFSSEAIAGANNPALVVEKIALSGDWMIPSVQIAATDKVAEILMRVDSKNSAAYRKAATSYKKRIKDKEAQILARAALAYKNFASRNIASFNIICASSLRDYIQWLGLKVVATYGIPDSITPEVVEELAAIGISNKVVLVVDSLQNGKGAGASIALRAGALRTVLSSYPGGFKNNDTWEKAIDRNTGMILGALDEC